MTTAPSLDDLINALARASVGDLSVRVEVPEGADPDASYTRLAYAINILLSDLEAREAERERAVEQLRTAAEALERRVAERTRALALANRELEEFNAMVAHDLRAPIRAVEHLAGALVEDHGDALGPDGRRIADAMERSAHRMRDLVDGLLVLARAAVTDLHTQPVDVGAIARGAFEDARRQEAPDRKAELVVAEGLQARADPRLLRVVLDNLIGNALKFTRREPVARIEVGEGPQPPEPGMRAFFVRDNGVGFDPAKASTMFGSFQRFHDPNAFEGTGVGLATVARIIERHGGTVRAEGATGQGATFHFTLPSVG